MKVSPFYSLASGAYQESIRINPDDAIAHNNLGLVYTNLGIYSFAIREHLEAIGLDPALQDAYFSLGIAYTRSGNAQKALETFEKAIALRPGDAVSYNNLAFVFFQSGKYKEARDASEKALRIKPDYAEAYYNLGVSCFKMDRTNDATEALRQSVRLKPNMPEAHFGLGVIYSEQDLPSALKEYEILKNLDPAGANALHEILEAKNVRLSEMPEAHLHAEKKKTRQPEATIASQEDRVSPAPVGQTTKEDPISSLPSVPQKETSPAPTPDSSAKGITSSVSADRSENNEEPETIMKSDRALQKDTYSVQVSVLESKQSAQALISRLKKKHYDVFMNIEKRVDQNTRYLILVGRFTEKSEAIKLAGTILKKEKMKSIIYRH